jgi:hypothetical protein
LFLYKTLFHRKWFRFKLFHICFLMLSLLQAPF